MSQTYQVPNNIPVSWLDRMTQFTNDTLMLASTPDNRTETQYMSEYFTYYDLYTKLSDEFNLAEIWEKIQTLWTKKVWLSDLVDNFLSVDMDPPYVISAIQQCDGNIVALSTYPLSGAMKNAFTIAGDNISAIIPSLSSKVHASSSDQYYITSITDANGYIQSVGTKALSDAVGTAISSSYKSVDSEENYISAISSYGGKITRLDTNQLSNVVSKVRYKQYPADQVDVPKPEFSNADLLQLNIVKLSYDAFMNLSVNNQLEASCLYMTINDPDDA